MSTKLQLPPDEIMRDMARLACEKAAADIADHADRFAQELPADMSEPAALHAFANAIRATNARTWPTKGGEQ